MSKTMTFAIDSIVNVHDGDTLTVVLDRGWSDYSQREVRISGIDAPEITGPTKPQGTKVRDAVRAWVARQTAMTLFSYQIVHDKYGRVMGDIIGNQAHPLSGYLLDNGLAKPYGGGTKQPWTPAELAVVDAFVIPAAKRRMSGD